LKRPAAFEVLRNRDFRLYWVGQAISLTGTWMQVMAQGWVVTRMSTSATVLGALTVTQTFPMLALSMVAGALADKVEKRRILIVTQALMMILAFVLAALVFSHRITLLQIFILAGLLGTVTAFDLPAAQAFPPELVQPAEIPKAVALLQSVFHGSRLIGPAVAGFLVAQFGEGSAFLANGISFIAVIAMLLAIPDRHRSAEESARRGRGGIGAGFRYVRHQRMVGSLMMLTALTTTFVFPFIAVLMVYYVRHVLVADARGLGMLMSASGFGALSGALVLLFGNSHTLRRWLLAGILGCGVGIVGLSLTHHVLPAVPLVLTMSFSVSSLMGRISQTIQRVVPNELRGRVMGVFGIAFTGLMPYAALGLSGLADVIGFAAMLRITAAVYVALSLFFLLRVPPLRDHVPLEPAAARNEALETA
jgi:MFS family permease